jgi:hypothetical protein
MSIKNAMATALGALLTLSAWGARAQDTKPEEGKSGHACCMATCAQHASGENASGEQDSGGRAAHDSGRMRCSLTGQTMETCCCIHREGKLHCTLADKDVESCCCKPGSEGTEEPDEAGRTGNEKPRD